MRKIYYGVAVLIMLVLVGVLVQRPHPVNNTTAAPPTPTAPQSALGQATKTTGCTETNGLPDPACTPGGIDPAVTQENIYATICVSGYSESVRPPEAVTNIIKIERMTAYNDSDTMTNYELDHLVSLELGGCPACVANLWPEPYNIPLGAHEKDKVENYLHMEVCDGVISLHDAQKEIATDWVSVYNRLPKN